MKSSGHVISQKVELSWLFSNESQWLYQYSAKGWCFVPYLNLFSQNTFKMFDSERIIKNNYGDHGGENVVLHY